MHFLHYATSLRLAEYLNKKQDRKSGLAGLFLSADAATVAVVTGCVSASAAIVSAAAQNKYKNNNPETSAVVGTKHK